MTEDDLRQLYRAHHSLQAVVRRGELPLSSLRAVRKAEEIIAALYNRNRAKLKEEIQS